jgi:hypothetical protein
VSVGVALEVDVLVFEAAPKPLDEDVVEPTAAPIHRDADASFGEPAGEGGARELAALVRIEDAGIAEAGERFLERGDAKRYVHGVRQPPREHGSACPVHHRDEVEESSADRHVGDVRRPHLVRLVDDEVAQQIREDLVPWRRLRRPALRPQRGDTHLPHQPLHALAVDALPVRREHFCQAARAEEWPRREQLVDPPHQRQIVLVRRCRRPVHAGTRDAQELALPADRQRPVAAIDERAAVRSAHLPDLLAKKSRSTISSPIFACSRSISRSRSEAASPFPVSNARAACSSSCFFQAYI